MKKGLKFDNEDTIVVSESQPTKTVVYYFCFYISAPSCLKIKGDD